VQQGKVIQELLKIFLMNTVDVSDFFL